MKDWKEAKKELQKETKRIWLQEPDEIKKLRLGIIDTGAAAYGQYFGALVFVHGFLMNTGLALRFYLLDTADEPMFTLEQMKYLARKVVSRTRSIGFCGLKGVETFGNIVLESLDSLQTKSDLTDLIGTLHNYIFRMFFWVHDAFPWWLGMSFQTKTEQQISEMLSLMKQTKSEGKA